MNLTPALRDRYRINVVFVPTRSSRSIALTKQLACLSGDVGLKAVLAGTTEQLPQARAQCAGFVVLQKRVATATLVGVNATPYLIAPDTRIHAGRPKDLARWLNDNDDSD
jgi:thiol:disulfide interchange protein DsbC